MSVLWYLFELSVNVFQGIAIIYFTYVCLGSKTGDSFVKSYGLCYGLILAASITVMNYFTAFENLMAFFYVFFVLFYSVVYLNKSLLTKILISIFVILIMLLCSAFVSNFMAFLLGTSLDNILYVYNIDRFITVISVQLMVLLFMALSASLFKRFDGDKDELGKYEWLLIIVVFVISCLICAFLYSLSLETLSHEGKRQIVLAVAGVILINVVVCFLVRELGKKNAAVRENELLKLEQIYNRQLIDNANAEFENIRKLKHDFKNSYSVVYTLLTDNKKENAMDFIKRSLDQYTYTDVFVNTNNEIVNAVINSKFSRAKAYKIDVSCLSVSDFAGIDDMDLARLLTNLIDNAITACAEVQDKAKHIQLKISSDEYKYDISIRNTISGSVLQANPQLLSTKNDSSEHGYGIKIIRDISDKYNGRCDFYEEGDHFCCKIILRK